MDDEFGTDISLPYTPLNNEHRTLLRQGTAFVAEATSAQLAFGRAGIRTRARPP